MKIAITGANGIVGRCVVTQATDEGHSVIGIDAVERSEYIVKSDKYSFIQADLRDFEVTLKSLRDCGAVIHLAGIRSPGDGRAETHNTNVTISWNVLRAATELGITRIAQASSINAIGLYYNLSPASLDYLPLDEEHPCRPDDPYSLSKVICEQQADAIVRRYPHIRIASLRPHHVVPSRDIPLKSAKGNAWKHLWGYTLEGSCARAFLLAVTVSEASFPNSHQVFFVVEPDIASNEDISVLLERHWKDIPVRKDIKTTGFFDCGKLERFLGWKADSVKE
ncbi:hypothetical protein Clacol_005801 [Clathrus columnatus]|uniref:NAD-dependent epimerase/dehydratase domain-containing protein n=1 Tax=Clathrus columnatus TaxID=1419009 RepID=A0AAV5AAB3_9AGAM|nr:hypothetical protein Clacol_005801 [Clathrus columnatus]